MTTATFYQQLAPVPPPIREWFGSEELVDKILALQEKFGITPTGKSPIARLLFRLETKQLPWEEFKAALIKELNILPLKADEIFDEIKLSLLMPIARELAAYGIGAKEFAVVGGPPKPPSFVGPMPPSPTKLPSFFTSDRAAAPPTKPVSFPQSAPSVASAPPPHPGATPAPQTTTSGAPRPVILRQETQTGAVRTTFNVPASIPHAGDQLKNLDVPLPPPRAARVEFGKATPRYDGAPLPTVRVQKETAPARPVNYSFDANKFISGGGEISFGPDLGVTTPAATPQAQTSSPPVAPLEMPIPAAPVLESAPPESEGILDRIMQKIAPWHYARFSKGAARATGMLEGDEPSKTVNYIDTAPVAPPPGPAAAPAPSTPGAPPPVPKPLGDSFPEPPKPLS